MRIVGNLLLFWMYVNSCHRKTFITWKLLDVESVHEAAVERKRENGG